MAIYKTVNTKGRQYLSDWILATAKGRNGVTTPAALSAWCGEAEQSICGCNAPIVEMPRFATHSGRQETFTIPDDGIDEEEIEE